MEEQDKKKTIEKMKKVLALLEGAKTESEAKAASLKLQELLAKNHMNISEIEEACADEARAEVDEVMAEVGCGGGTKWKNNLANIIAANYRCETYERRSRRGGRDVGRWLVFVGEGGDAGLARKVFEVTVEVAQRLYRKWCADTREEKRARWDDLQAPLPEWQRCGFRWSPSSSERDGWYLGFAAGLKRAYEEQVSSSEELTIALAVPASVRERMGELSKGFRPERKARSRYLDGRAFDAGNTAGHGYGSGDRLTA